MPKRPTKKKTGKPGKAKPQKQASELSWVQIDQYLRLAAKQVGSREAAAIVLERELEGGKRSWMRSDIKADIREQGEPSFWAGHLIDLSIGSVLIYRCKPGDKTDPRRWAFYTHPHDDLVSGDHTLRQRGDLLRRQSVQRHSAGDSGRKQQGGE